MKRIFIIFGIVLLSGLFSQGTAASENSQADNLENKTLVARIYSDWRAVVGGRLLQFVPFGREEKYKTIKVQIKNRSFSVEPSQIPQAETGTEVVVLLHPYDQADEAVRGAMNNMVYILPLKEIPTFRFRPAVPDTRRSYQLVDALGKPVPACRVDIFISDGFDLSKVQVGAVVTDANGSFKTLNVYGNFGQYYLFIKDPNYGSFYINANHYMTEPNYTLTTVNIHSEFLDRAIRGIVETADGKPVWGATIDCQSAVTPAGALVQPAVPAVWCRAITDENGRFVLYMTPRDSLSEPQLPSLSRYNITVRPPQWSSLVPYNGYITSGRDSKIVLEPAGIVRQFIFQDANGPITDGKLLAGLNVNILTAEKKNLRLLYSELRNPKATPAGKYTVQITTPGYFNLGFNTVEVNEQPVVIFEAKQRRQAASYTGKIIDASTGQPLQNVYIIMAGGPQNGNELLKQLTPLDKVVMGAGFGETKFTYTKIEITDKDGIFQTFLEPEEQGRSFYIYKKDYTPINFIMPSVSKYNAIETDGTNNYNLGTIDLLPCAYIVYEPCCDTNDMITVQRKISGQLIPATASAEPTEQFVNQPKWYEDYHRKYFVRNPVSTITGLPPVMALQPRRQQLNTENMRIVPAGVDIKFIIRFNNPVRYPGAMNIYPFITDVFTCKQGETINLGKIYFTEEIPVFVKVTDFSGKTLAGVEVRHSSEDENMLATRRSITDANGIAKLRVPLGIKTAFFIGRTGAKTKNIKQSLPYQPKGPEEANSMIIFQLNDEVVRDLFDENSTNLPDKSRGLIPY